MLDPTADQTALNVDPNIASDVGIGSLIHHIGDVIVDLLDEENGPHKGHAIKDHVNRTDDWLRARIRDSYEERLGIFFETDTRAGTFPSVEAANKLINSILSRNLDVLTEVAAGRLRRVALKAFFLARLQVEKLTLLTLGNGMLRYSSGRPMAPQWSSYMTSGEQRVIQF